MATVVRGLGFRVVDPKDVPANNGLKGRPSRYLVTVSEFLQSGAQAAAVEEQATNPTCVGAGLRKAITRAGMGSKLKAFVRDGTVYLVRVQP